MRAQSVLTRGVAEQTLLKAVEQHLKAAGFETSLKEGVGDRDKKVLVLATTAPLPDLQAARAAAWTASQKAALAVAA